MSRRRATGPGAAVLVAALALGAVPTGAVTARATAPVPVLAPRTPAVPPDAPPASPAQARIVDSVAGLPAGPTVASGAALRTVPVGALRSNVRGVHRVTVVPMWSRKRPDLAAMRRVAADVAEFWTREVPRLRFRFRFVRAVPLPGGACAFEAAAPRARQVVGGALARGEHVAAWAPDCQPSGQGELLDGRGVVFVGGLEASALAHELGHNLGLNHANLLTCRSGGSTVALARRCREQEYGDTFDIMGAGIDGESILADKRLSALGQLLLGGRVTRVRGAGTLDLSDPGGGGPVVAVLKSRLGALLLDAAPAGGARLDSGSESPAGLHVRVVTRPCPSRSLCGLSSGLLLVPEFSGTVGDPVLELGDAWEPPGTGKRLVVTGAGDRGVRVTVVPAGAPAAPTAPVVTGPDGVVSSLPWTVSWAPSPEAVAYVVMVGDVAVARAPGDRTQVQVPPLDGLTDADGTWLSTSVGDPVPVSVVAVSASGGRSASASLAVPIVVPEVDVAADRPLNPAGGPVTVTWAPRPASAASAVTSWRVDVNGVVQSLPPTVRSIQLDPATLPRDEFGGIQASVSVEGLDATGAAVFQGYWSDYWYSPADPTE